MKVDSEYFNGVAERCFRDFYPGDEVPDELGIAARSIAKRMSRYGIPKTKTLLRDQLERSLATLRMYPDHPKKERTIQLIHYLKAMHSAAVELFASAN